MSYSLSHSLLFREVTPRGWALVTRAANLATNSSSFVWRLWLPCWRRQTHAHNPPPTPQLIGQLTDQPPFLPHRLLPSASLFCPAISRGVWRDYFCIFINVVFVFIFVFQWLPKPPPRPLPPIAQLRCSVGHWQNKHPLSTPPHPRLAASISLTHCTWRLQLLFVFVFFFVVVILVIVWWNLWHACIGSWMGQQQQQQMAKTRSNNNNKNLSTLAILIGSREEGSGRRLRNTEYRIDFLIYHICHIYNIYVYIYI